jgi:hypothetical protein
MPSAAQVPFLFHSFIHSIPYFIHNFVVLIWRYMILN